MQACQQYIISLKKKDGFTIIAYARKSNGSETDEVKTKLIYHICMIASEPDHSSILFLSHSTVRSMTPYIYGAKRKREETLEELKVDDDTNG